MDTSPSKLCSACNKVRPVTDFPWKPQPRNDPDQPRERAKTCGSCKEKRDNRRRPRQDLEPTAPSHTRQEIQDNDGPPPPKRPRLESATAAEARDPEDEEPEEDVGEPEAVDMMDTSLSKQCSRCHVVRPVTDFPWKPQPRNDPDRPGERAKTCWPCKVRRDNRRRPMQDGATVPEAIAPAASQPANMMDSSSRRCRKCNNVRPVADFPLRRQLANPSEPNQLNQPPQRLKTCRQCR
ncbi:hypothetical protein E4U46_007635, partial [Claviceps purpurea]